MKSKFRDEELTLKHPNIILCPPPKLGLQFPICAQTLTCYPMEEWFTVEEVLTGQTWMERIGCMFGEYLENIYTTAGLGGCLKTLRQLVFCVLPGYIFICQVDEQLWATNCLCNYSTPMQCMLGTLITWFSINSFNIFKHWARSLKL